MGSIIKAIKINHFDLKKERGWDKTYWAIDIHGTILKPNYQKGNIPKEFYPYAIECLQYLTQRKDIVLIKYTCSHLNEIEEYKVYFESLGIKFDYIFNTLIKEEEKVKVLKANLKTEFPLK